MKRENLFNMSLLEKLLTLEDCAKCQFCCSYRRRSLWETIIFTPEEVEIGEGLSIELNFTDDDIRENIKHYQQLFNR